MSDVKWSKDYGSGRSLQLVTIEGGCALRATHQSPNGRHVERLGLTREEARALAMELLAISWMERS
jgi:hypothetical protein